MRKILSFALILTSIILSFSTIDAKKTNDDSQNAEKADKHERPLFPDGFFDVSGHTYEGSSGTETTMRISFKKSGLAYVKTTRGISLIASNTKGGMVTWEYEGNGMIRLNLESRMPMYFQIIKDGKQISSNGEYRPMVLSLVR